MLSLNGLLAISAFSNPHPTDLFRRVAASRQLFPHQHIKISGFAGVRKNCLELLPEPGRLVGWNQGIKEIDSRQGSPARDAQLMDMLDIFTPLRCRTLERFADRSKRSS